MLRAVDIIAIMLEAITDRISNSYLIQCSLVLNALYVIYVFFTVIRQRHRQRLIDSMSSQELEDAELKSISVNWQNLEEKNSKGWTALHQSLKENFTKATRKLIESGASLNCQTTYLKITPLHMLVFNGANCDRYLGRLGTSSAMIELLLSKGADPNITSICGASPIYFAATGKDAVWSAWVIGELAKHGAHVDLRTCDKSTALANAVNEKMDANIIQQLLCWGADIHDKAVARCLPQFEDATECLKEHWIKLYAANLMCFGNWDAGQVIASYDTIYQECLNEVCILKNTFVDSSTSLYQFLHMDPVNRCIQIKNEKLKNMIGSPTLQEQLPKCFILILRKYREAVTRKSILEPAKEIWLELTNIKLPDICIERIFAHMSNADIHDLIRIYKNPDNLTVLKNWKKSLIARCIFAYRIFRDVL